MRQDGFLNRLLAQSPFFGRVLRHRDALLVERQELWNRLAQVPPVGDDAPVLSVSSAISEARNDWHLDLPQLWCVACWTVSHDVAFGLREGSNCPKCGSSSRDRAVVAGAISASLTFGRRLESFIGISDSAVVESALQRFFGDRYINHQYHCEPRIDLLDIAPKYYEGADVVTCSDVLEHVQRPVALAFSGLYKLLRPGGVAIITVPHIATGVTVEHFPELSEYTIVESDNGKAIMIAKLKNGSRATFTELVFHGGEGHTLEHRVFSRDGLISELLDAGFIDVRPLWTGIESLGISWEPWSLCWIAQKPSDLS
jgi:SAM-dependent methyltransferase